MLKNKRGQWAGMMARERRSQERRERLGMTKELLKQGLTADDIAYKLGISGNTVRQYIREVGHLAGAEQNIDTLLGRINSLREQVKEFQGSTEASSLRKFVRKNIQILNLIAEVTKQVERIGTDFTDLDLKPVVESMYASVYSTIISSVYNTFLNEKNRNRFPLQDQERFKRYFNKWKRAIGRGLILKGDYETFLAEAQRIAKRKILVKLPSVIKAVEKKVKLKEVIGELEKESDPILKRFDLSIQDIRTSGVYVWDAREMLLKIKAPLLISGMLIIMGSFFFGFILTITALIGYGYQLQEEEKIRLKNKIELAKKNRTLKFTLVARAISTLILIFAILRNGFFEPGADVFFLGLIIMGIWYYENRIIKLDFRKN